jgi:single-strand DNA-binding protein
LAHMNVNGEGVVGSIKDIHFLQDGKAVLNVSVAVTPSRFSNDEWIDLPTMWYSLSVWGKAGENLAEVLNVGDRCSFSGNLTMEEYQRKDGTTGQDYRVTVRAGSGSFGIIPKPLKVNGGGEDTPWK